MEVVAGTEVVEVRVVDVQMQADDEGERWQIKCRLTMNTQQQQAVPKIAR